MISPSFTGYSPLRMWTSVPQIVVSVTRMTASPTPGSGRGTSRSPIFPVPEKTAALIVLPIGYLLPRSSCGSAGDDARSQIVAHALFDLADPLAADREPLADIRQPRRLFAQQALVQDGSLARIQFRSRCGQGFLETDERFPLFATHIGTMLV